MCAQAVRTPIPGLATVSSREARDPPTARTGWNGVCGGVVVSAVLVGYATRVRFPLFGHYKPGAGVHVRQTSNLLFPSTVASSKRQQTQQTTVRYHSPLINSSTTNQPARARAATQSAGWRCVTAWLFARAGPVVWRPTSASVRLVRSRRTLATLGPMTTVIGDSRRELHINLLFVPQPAPVHQCWPNCQRQPTTTEAPNQNQGI